MSRDPLARVPRRGDSASVGGGGHLPFITGIGGETLSDNTVTVGPHVVPHKPLTGVIDDWNQRSIFPHSHHSLRPSPPLAILTVRGLVVFLDLGSRHRGSGGVFLAPRLDEQVPPHPAPCQLENLLAERPRQFLGRLDDQRVIVGVESGIVVQAFDQFAPCVVVFEKLKQLASVDHLITSSPVPPGPPAPAPATAGPSPSPAAPPSPHRRARPGPRRDRSRALPR